MFSVYSSPIWLVVGPYLFTKIQRALVKHWRSEGFRIFTYLDDRAGADQVLNKAMKMSTVVRKDTALRFHCQWGEKPVGPLTVVDLQHIIFRVPARRVEALK